MDFEDEQGRSVVGGQLPSPPWRCGLLLSLIVLNVFLPSLVLSYGIILAYNVEQGGEEWMSLICPTVFTVAFCLSQCWCREAADSWGGEGGHRVLAGTGVVVVFAGVAACALTPPVYHPLLYGLLGGLGTSLVSSQVDAVVFDTFETRLGIVQGLCYAGQAIGQFVLPHIFLQLLECYGTSEFYLVLSALMLQTLPGVMSLKVTMSVRRPHHNTALVRNYALFSNDLSTTSYHSELQLHDLSKKCWQSPSDDNIHRIALADDEGVFDKQYFSEIPTTITPPPSPEEKRKNPFGVEILPEIPEESEASGSSDSDSDVDCVMKVKRKHLQSAIKRLSVMSDNFEEYITKENGRRYSEKDENDNRRNSEIEVMFSNIAPMTEIKHEHVLNSFGFRCNLAFASMKRSVCIPSYRLYKIRRRFRFCLCCLNDTFIKPLTRSLSCWRFYPALLLCFSKLSLTLITSALIPIFSLRAFPKISLLENNFLFSLHAFTWLCFLLSTPWIAHMPKRNYKYIALGGLMVTTSSLYVISNAPSHDALAVGCVAAGFGFGAITFAWETAARDFVGVRTWSKIQSTLETLSAACLALFVVGLAYLIRMVDGLRLCLMALAIVQAVVTVVWLSVSIVSFYKGAVKSYRLTKSIWSQ